MREIALKQMLFDGPPHLDTAGMAILARYVSIYEYDHRFDALPNFPI